MNNNWPGKNSLFESILSRNVRRFWKKSRGEPCRVFPSWQFFHSRSSPKQLFPIAGQKFCYCCTVQFLLVSRFLRNKLRQGERGMTFILRLKIGSIFFFFYISQNRYDIIYICKLYFIRWMKRKEKESNIYPSRLNWKQSIWLYKNRVLRRDIIRYCFVSMGSRFDRREIWGKCHRKGWAFNQCNAGRNATRFRLNSKSIRVALFVQQVTVAFPFLSPWIKLSIKFSLTSHRRVLHPPFSFQNFNFWFLIFPPDCHSLQEKSEQKRKVEWISSMIDLAWIKLFHRSPIETIQQSNFFLFSWRISFLINRSILDPTISSSVVGIMEFEEIFWIILPFDLDSISVEGKKKEEEEARNWEVDSISLLINVFVSKFRNQPAFRVTRKRRWKKEERGGKKYSIDSHGQGRMYFFWKHRHHLVSPSSFLKRMEKQYFDVSRAPSFPFPYHIPPVSRCTFFSFFFVSDFFVPTNYTYIYRLCMKKEKK